MAYGWCSAIGKEYQGLDDGKELLFLSLKVGFRGLDVRYHWTDTGLVHTKYHQRMGKIVFDSGDVEVVSDLLQAWTTYDYSQTLYKLFDTWPMHLIRLQRTISTSQRLRGFVIRSVECLGPQQVEQVGVEEFAALLDRLGVGVDDMGSENDWVLLLLYVVRSPQGRRSLSYPYWELMMELAIDKPWFRNDPIDYDLEVMLSLEEEGEWDKMECWGGFVWLIRCPKTDTITEDLERLTVSLFRQRPGAVKKLEQLVRRSRMNYAPECLECLQWICEREGLEATSQSHTR